jgi:hypothetical protein
MPWAERENHTAQYCGECGNDLEAREYRNCDFCGGLFCQVHANYSVSIGASSRNKNSCKNCVKEMGLCDKFSDIWVPPHHM